MLKSHQEELKSLKNGSPPHFEICIFLKMYKNSKNPRSFPFSLKISSQEEYIAVHCQHETKLTIHLQITLYFKCHPWMRIDEEHLISPEEEQFDVSNCFSHGHQRLNFVVTWDSHSLHCILSFFTMWPPFFSYFGKPITFPRFQKFGLRKRFNHKPPKFFWK